MAHVGQELRLRLAGALGGLLLLREPPLLRDVGARAQGAGAPSTVVAQRRGVPGDDALVTITAEHRVLPVAAGIDQAAPGFGAIATPHELAHPAPADHLLALAAQDPAALGIDELNDALLVDDQHDDLGDVEVALRPPALLLERLFLLLALRHLGDQCLVRTAQEGRVLAPARLNP